MMLMLVGAGLALLVWVIIRPAWLPKPPDNKATARIARGTEQVRRTAQGWLGSLRRRSPNDRVSTQGFRDWATEHLPSAHAAVYPGRPEETAGLKAWLAGLSAEQAGAFARATSDFCQGLGFELAWLWDEKIDGPQKEAQAESVLHYSLATWKAHETCTQAAYAAWQAAPHKKENRAFAQKLYVKLVDAGLADAPADLLLAPEKERQAHMTSAIQSAAAENNAAVMALAREASVELAEAGTRKAADGTQRQAAPAREASPGAAEA